MARTAGGAALATAAIGSFVAGTIATGLLTFAAPAISELAFVFGPPEYFALTIPRLHSVSAVMGASPVRGLSALHRTGASGRRPGIQFGPSPA